MPEGDAVRRTAMRLDDALAGRTLTRTDFRWPTLATVDLAGANVIRTATYGKHLLTRLMIGPSESPAIRPESGRLLRDPGLASGVSPPASLPADHDREALTLHTHLKMEGSWRTVRAGERWPGPARDVRVALRTDATEAVGFLLGVVELLPTAAEHLITDRLGPDLLDPEHDADEAVRRLLADPDRALGAALLDQTVVAGLGTIFVSETCFVAGAHPQAPVASVADATRLLDRAARMLTVAVREGRPVTTGNRRSPLWVYRRHRQPCVRCGTTIEAGPVGPADRERTLYWCPACQPPAAAPGARRT